MDELFYPVFWLAGRNDWDLTQDRKQEREGYGVGPDSARCVAQGAGASRRVAHRRSGWLGRIVLQITYRVKSPCSGVPDASSNFSADLGCCPADGDNAVRPGYDLICHRDLQL